MEVNGQEILLGRGCDPTEKFIAVYLAKGVVSSLDTRLGRSPEEPNFGLTVKIKIKRKGEGAEYTA